MYSTRKEIKEAVIEGYNRIVKSKVEMHYCAEQLYYCKAWIFDISNSEFVLLQRYDTIVAAYQRSTGILWVFDFYSHTTAQHIEKFCTWIRYTYKTGRSYPRTVKLYNDSKTGKRAARKNLDDDFASVIASALNQQ